MAICIECEGTGKPFGQKIILTYTALFEQKLVFGKGFLFKMGDYFGQTLRINRKMNEVGLDKPEQGMVKGWLHVETGFYGKAKVNFVADEILRLAQEKEPHPSGVQNQKLQPIKKTIKPPVHKISPATHFILANEINPLI